MKTKTLTNLATFDPMLDDRPSHSRRYPSAKKFQSPEQKSYAIKNRINRDYNG